MPSVSQQALPLHILLCEPHPDHNQLIANQLDTSGLLVDRIYNARQLTERLAYYHYDAMIINSLLPDQNILALINDLRMIGLKTPVLYIDANESNINNAGLQGLSQQLLQDILQASAIPEQAH
ncbi:MAG: response regulator [Gammaproteobacteria bacterium]|nr:response regulator [Gammaproteobacteria bacterium]